VDFAFTPEETAFRAELVAFLDEELAPWWRHIFAHEERSTAAGRELAGKLADRGWLTMSWPTEYGGSAAGAWMQVVLREEMWSRGEPRGPQYMNVNYIGPMIMAFGTEEQKRRFLTPMSRGAVIWCQGFSERVPGRICRRWPLVPSGSRTGSG
jgi:alkylation response protein AidB-like acyl-CoA dehydrogenase